MIRYHGNDRLIGIARRLMLTTLVVVVAGGATSLEASASTPMGHHRGKKANGHDGFGNKNIIKIRSANGKFNKSFSSAFNPTVNRGFQQVANTNVSGITNTQVAFCKRKHRSCRISQKMWTKARAK